MHENFLSYIMIGLSRGLASWANPMSSNLAQPARRSEEEIVLEWGRRERARQQQAERERAEAEKPGPAMALPISAANAGSWRRGSKEPSAGRGTSRLPSFVQPSICG